MNKTLWVAAVILTAGVLVNGGTPRKAASLANNINKIIINTVKSGEPGVAVMVRKNGRTVFARGYGLRDLQSRIAIDAQTNFRLASCTKQFTAMAIMLLVHDRKLGYEQRLTDIFPDFPAYGKQITIRDLLNHTSGLPDYEALMDQISMGKDATWTQARQIQDEEVLALLKTQKSGKFAPGTQWSYSNSGYVVLGLVTARVSGRPFEEFLRERIFRPLKMEHTVAYVKGRNEVPDRAYGYTNSGGVFTQTDQSATSATLGDGGVYSNLEDLAKWDDALTHYTLLDAKEMQAATTPVKVKGQSKPHWSSGPGDTDPLAGKQVAYGFGWFLDPYLNHPRMWHYGDTVGFKTAIERFTKDNLTVVILCNRSDLDAASLALKLFSLRRNMP